GLTVIGALVASVIKINVAPVFKTGEVSLSLQTEVLDKIMPSLLPALLTLVVYKLIASKKMSVIQIIFGIIVLSIILSYFGILKA
ncbi:MAG: PTS system mannose/fructose/sorbose family transporter subunit IID, partial [Streptococcus sp.]|nr:PTS system mannose/fructose/sorbose family transporter subunit IID [Streptococcus sp.]